ncbi:SUMF1/EgtB/PvdO family nonheme iron enzyme [Methylocapsa palsarum]|uniref:Formylglycine-generating enzyme, required for sulfatase activity, contains SUMF1/FGE domain n=1 Tax=Methylocapsa palsarum TaxID=1612308 RepID=A0A1I4CC54_9HYPH|nr:SUMF1/EgtB/PvdO family nonheme iron enzyme [Methylocapsa palsarum]SFK78190.1 Formylglycine-generating enzyme, required for sulfatase activity, contains SUMF1/FGE domain [Methylocapsa palsarum]
MRVVLLRLLGGVASLILSLNIAGAQHTEGSPDSGPRLALVIGNSAYAAAGAPLATPIKNARMIAEELRHDGFSVDLRENLGEEAMRNAIASLSAKIKPAATALFFFSGYGVAVKGRSYLIPVDAEIWNEADVETRGVGVEQILGGMESAGAKVEILVLDASRRNPFERRFRTFSSGLGGLAGPPGSLIIAAAETGKVIKDPEGDGGVFIGELVKEMRTPGLSAEDVFRQTRIGVLRATRNEQAPYVWSSLKADFSFDAPNGKSAKAGQATGMISPQRAEVPVGPPPDDLKPGSVFRDCAACPEVVIAPAGEFNMGSEEFGAEQPVHLVVIPKPFAIGREEVTYAQWDACVDDGGCGGWRPDDHGRDRTNLQTNLPVSEVSWTDARAYLEWLSGKSGRAYRLPSEAEWEYAARAGSATAYWWGDATGTGHANCRGCGGDGRVSPVDSYQPNGFGLYDVAGNVAEWVEDCWNDSYADAPRDGAAYETGSCKQRVVRGGSFDTGPRYVRSASRFLTEAGLRYYTNGFRVVRDLP